MRHTGSVIWWRAPATGFILPDPTRPAESDAS